MLGQISGFYEEVLYLIVDGVGRGPDAEDEGFRIVVVSSGALVGIGIRRGGRKGEITVSSERPCRIFYKGFTTLSGCLYSRPR